MADDAACEATPASELERQIMSPSVPKNEREWWAAREIERLRDAVEAMQWRPISEAVVSTPDDELLVIAHGKHHIAYRMDDLWMDVTGQFSLTGVTHYVPLPSPEGT